MECLKPMNAYKLKMRIKIIGKHKRIPVVQWLGADYLLISYSGMGRHGESRSNVILLGLLY